MRLTCAFGAKQAGCVLERLGVSACRVPMGGERPVMVASMFRGVRRLGSREFCKNPAKLREIAGFGQRLLVAHALQPAGRPFIETRKLCK